MLKTKFNKMTTTMNVKKYITPSNIITTLLLAFALAMFIKPELKGFVIENLMKIGLFQPNVPESPKEQVAAVTTSNEAPTEGADILFKNPEGHVIELGDLKGNVVFINFWATWCPPCIAEMPSIQKLYDGLKGNDKVKFLMVDVDNQAAKSKKFMDKKKYDLPVYTPAGPIPPSFMAGAIPTTVVLDKYGKVVFKHEGTADYSNAEFADFMKKLSSQ